MAVDKVTIEQLPDKAELVLSETGTVRWRVPFRDVAHASSTLEEIIAGCSERDEWIRVLLTETLKDFQKGDAQC